MTVLPAFTPGAWCRSVAMSAKVGAVLGHIGSGISFYILENPEGSRTKSGLGSWADSTSPDTDTFYHRTPKCLRILNFNVDLESRSSILNF